MPNFCPPIEIKPVSPSTISSVKLKVFPNFVIEAVNELLALHYVPGRPTEIKLKDVKDRIRSKMSLGVKFDGSWLNFESIYEDEGWDVSYYRDDYTESYDAYFEFTERK